ncbi:hypothetical protein GAY28_06260 [Azospirillum brasilense]|nr:hypothetical protein [Azospirillum brasilense]
MAIGLCGGDDARRRGALVPLRPPAVHRDIGYRGLLGCGRLAHRLDFGLLSDLLCVARLVLGVLRETLSKGEPKVSPSSPMHLARA